MGGGKEAKGADNPVLLYKLQQPYLNKHLILQATLQCAMMKDFGNNIICVG